MFSRARRGTGHGGPRVKSDRRRPSSKAVVGVEPLEGRTLLSYLVVVKNHKVIPIHVANARLNEPLFSNGLAFKHQAHFYPFYTGPKRPELNGVSATAVISGNRDTDGILTLSGTVAGPIIQKPKTAAQNAIYTFAIDRGGASKHGPFPGRGNIRYDAQVVANITQAGISAYVQLNNASINNPLATTRINLSLLKRQDQWGYHNDQGPAHQWVGQHADESDPIDRPCHRSVERQLLHTQPVGISSHRTVTTALPASPLRTRCFRSIYSMSRL